jgi:hypothetical protein
MHAPIILSKDLQAQGSNHTSQPLPGLDIR